MSYKALCISSVLMLMAAVSSKNILTGNDKEQQSADRQMHYGIKQILGANFLVEDEKIAGTVDNVIVDENGNVDFLVVVNRNNYFVTVPWDIARFNIERRTVFVPITEARFLQAPIYTSEHYPNYSAAAYRNQVYRFFGLTPARERRAAAHRSRESR